VVDVSGTTDAEGKATRGYDPTQDIVWLRSEIVNWIEGNLLEKWGSLKRRHVAVKAAAVDTLQAQLSGYGSTTSTINLTLLTDPLFKAPLETWSFPTVHQFVSNFVSTRFPTVLALNKIDHPDSSLNIAKISKAYPNENMVLCSAISEVFLRKLAKQGYLRYTEGSDYAETRDDLIEDGDLDGGGLKEMDEKLKTRVENLRDMVLFRFGSTGVVQTLTKAAEVLGLVPIFPVKNVTTFGAGGDKGPVFRDCVLVKKGMTVGEVARKVMGDAPLAYVEGAGGVRVSEDEVVGVGKCDVCIDRPLCLVLERLS
jgi:ribosome-binding ATPase YchF (GTP1/OBG family)